ncbi:ABC transporter permease [Clostridium luticellarii]|jgi:bacitracin transport system permease protein|uniref:ABC-2 family transporter protein n=1 Tax=Clostridium luticellarii TaxID=1691940 RepID=A0A2T0BM16_9CLOT|nr:ABC transporter permease [Clostridium luticellarii]CAB1239284.1 ABC-2 family transporter protein [Clostridiaceae bacterium BL-3]MCI1946012.1 ABC transporter permease [Clostridium luticellarii]MCI1969356.1 ABC transporter permease [Clostridium luticellarii]MCI1996056.1 ABC transporter permease [Clostridium luticellarii]MCI2040695.1 ABC transporter permease [Clostridium luticellarii]
MPNIIYCELLKLKRSYTSSLILIGGTAMTILMFLARFITESEMIYEKYAYNIDQINFLMIYPILFTLAAAYVFSREFSDKTASTLYTYPVSRFKIFMGKLISIYVLIFITYIVESLSIPVSYYFLHGAIPEYSLMITTVKAQACSLLFQFLLIPIPVLIVNMSKNMTIPSLYGILSFVLNTLLMDKTEHLEYIPTAYPYLSAAYIYNLRDIRLSCIIIGTVSIFILFISASLYSFCSQDIV